MLLNLQGGYYASKLAPQVQELQSREMASRGRYSQITANDRAIHGAAL